MPGNMTRLTRYGFVNGQKQVIDQLTMSHTGNQLTSTQQDAEKILKNGFPQFISYYKQGTQYIYNNNTRGAFKQLRFLSC